MQFSMQFIIFLRNNATSRRVMHSDGNFEIFPTDASIGEFPRGRRIAICSKSNIAGYHRCGGVRGDEGGGWTRGTSVGAPERGKARGVPFSWNLHEVLKRGGCVHQRSSCLPTPSAEDQRPSARLTSLFPSGMSDREAEREEREIEREKERADREEEGREKERVREREGGGREKERIEWRSEIEQGESLASFGASLRKLSYDSQLWILNIAVSLSLNRRSYGWFPSSPRDLNRVTSCRRRFDEMHHQLRVCLRRRFRSSTIHGILSFAIGFFNKIMLNALE